jgi:hypothetical protein
MALSLKDPEADRLAREVAARTGETSPQPSWSRYGNASLACAAGPGVGGCETSSVRSPGAVPIYRRSTNGLPKRFSATTNEGCRADGPRHIRAARIAAGQVSAARRAYRRFGKGRHAAALNFGDLFAYALAHTSGEPLLFKGDHFARTDVSRVS